MQFLRKYKYHIPVVFLCIAIFVQSSFPSLYLPKTEFELGDKLVHSFVYLILFFLFLYSLKNQNKSIKLKEHALLFSLLFTIIYGASDEIHQYFVPNRECDIYDWIADAVGALIGLLIILTVKLKFRKSFNIILLLVFLLSGCSGSDKKESSNEFVNSVSNVEAWYDLMPVVDKSKENFRFLVDAVITRNKKVERLSKNKLKVDDFKIHFKEYDVSDKKYTLEIKGDNTDTLSIRIYHDLNEFYVNRAETLPNDVSFSFDVFYNSQYANNVLTKTIAIQKVY